MKDNNMYIWNEFVFNNAGDVHSLRILEDFKKIRHLNNIVDESTLSSLLRALYLSYTATQAESPFNQPDRVTNYHSLLQKEQNFDQELINTEAEFDVMFERMKAQKGLLFRGLTEAKYAMYNMAQRKWIEQELNKKYASYPDFLNALLKNARSENNGILFKYLKNMGFFGENDLTILSYLQHHHCPTPLLDWSENFQVGIYFATLHEPESKPKKYIDKYSSVYFLEKKYFEELSVNRIMYESIKANEAMLRENIMEVLINENLRVDGELSFETLRHLVLSNIGEFLIAEMSKIEHLMPIPVSYLSDINEQYPIPKYLLNNLNIISQEGSFTWSNDPLMPLEVVIRRENSKSEAHKDNLISYCININKKLNGYIQKKLIASGIGEDFIYANPNKLAANIFEKTVS